jgi:glutamine synthetase
LIISHCEPFLILFDREAKTASDVDFLVGFETEFILLKSTTPIEPVSIHAWTSADALRSGSTATTVVAEMVHAIELSGIEVQIYHGEAAPGQVGYYLHN